MLCVRHDNATRYSYHRSDVSRYLPNRTALRPGRPPPQAPKLATIGPYANDVPMRKKSVGWAGWALSLTTIAASAQAGNPYVEAPRDYASTPAHAYAEMDSDACLGALDERQIAYERASAGALVDAPVVLTGPLHGVSFKHVHPRASGAVLDCRLALALDDFAELLVQHHIVEVGFVAAFRPDASGRAKPGQRHPAGLAMDIQWFRRDDGQRLVVLDDYEGRVGAKTCGARAQAPAAENERGRSIRKLVCDAANARMFHLLLTPNYDTEHHDHVHVEVRRDVQWFLVQ